MKRCDLEHLGKEIMVVYDAIETMTELMTHVIADTALHSRRGHRLFGEHTVDITLNL
jgi:hypothetical protein